MMATLSGFICKSEEDFRNTLSLLLKDKEKLNGVKNRAKQDVVSKYNTTTLVLDYLGYLKELEEL